MIPTKTDRNTVQAGAMQSAAFQISATNGGHIMGILREGLYSDRPLAVLREYGANAWDAHRAAGKHDVPIEVTLPSSEVPVLKIRDRGPGLSHTEMFELYTQYGDSTKRDTNDAVGMMGIGSKSAFCYTEQFTITSWHGGMKRVYMASLGDDDVGGIALVHEEVCWPEDTGLEILIATKPEDKYEFHSTARELYQHFEPRPTIMMATEDGDVPDIFALPDLPDERTVLASGTIFPESGQWIAIMGCVPYRVDMSKLDAREVNPALQHMSGRLKFGIGEVQVSSSRENLKYTPATKKVLVERANALVDEYVLHALSELEAGNVTGWAARLQVRVLQALELPLPDEWKPLAEAYAKVTYEGLGFTIVHNKSGCTRVVVEDGTRLLIDDTNRDLSGYDLDSEDYVVRAVADPVTGATLTTDELRAAVDAMLADAKLTGLKVELLSTRYWRAPAPDKPKRGSGWKNPKHRAKMFQLADHSLPKKKSPKSDNWEAVTRVPTHDDVYIIIESFVAKDDENFWSDVNSDRDLCKALGVDFPPIYGYKSTEKSPVTDADCVGTPYRQWRDAFFRSLMTDERRATLEQCWLSSPDDIRVPYTDEFALLTKNLGEAHPIVSLFRDIKAAKDALAEASVDRDALTKLGYRCNLTYEGSWVEQHVTAVFAPYKLLNRVGVRNLWRTNYSYEEDTRDEWVEYVKMVDAHLAPAPQNVVPLRSVS